MNDAVQEDAAAEERPIAEPLEISHPSATSEGCSSFSAFLTSDQVSIPSISASLVPSYRGISTVTVLPTAVTGDIAKHGTVILLKEAASGVEQKLVFSKFDVAELNSLFIVETFVDAFFSLDPYDYQQNAGIRLVADKLIIDF